MLVDFLGVWILVPLGFLVYYAGKWIHRNEYKVYLGVLVVSLLLSVLILIDVRSIPLLQSLIIEGHLSFSMFVIVMFGGAFSLGSKPKKYLMQIRREFALMGFLLLIPHGIYRLDLALGGYNITGLWAFLIMIPLVIVSYPKVRKKIKAITWKRVHKMAYIVYLFIYVHVGFSIFVSDSFRQFTIEYDAWPYHLVFLVYLILKSRVIYNKKRKKMVAS